MKIRIYPKTKIFIVAPAGYSSGGPDSLHTLAYYMKTKFNIPTYMVYLPFDKKNPIHPKYKFYNIPYTNFIEDKRKNILILPEICDLLFISKYFNKIRKIIWWLSVDNFYKSIMWLYLTNGYVKSTINYYVKYLGIKETSINNIKKLISPYLKLENIDEISSALIHLVNSYYAKNFLINSGFKNIAELFSCINNKYFKIKYQLNEKENIVLYNPKKGYEFTKKIMDFAKEIRFIPLQNMSTDDVINYLLKAKVYIDFGHHPGRERLPREAAILGCCVITSKNGSANFYEDVPIPDKYKFEDKIENIPVIIERIKDCFVNYNERYKDFESYRERIKNEPKKFEKYINNIFEKV